MLDIKLLRDNPEKVRQGIASKNVSPSLVNDFLALDKEWRHVVKNIDDLRAEQRKAEEARNIEKAKSLKEELKTLAGTLKELEKKREVTLRQLPNLPLESVPQGKGESENIVLHEVGEKPMFAFKPKNHLELGSVLGIIDFETGSKVSGHGFYYLKNEGLLLELALIHYALTILQKKGFTLLLTPDMARERFYLGTGYLPRGEEAQTYEIKNSDLGLIATAEVTLAGYHADEILKDKNLPLRYAGYSHCFRQEEGGYGKYSKGLYRVHQFTKVEMFAYTRPDDSEQIHKEFLEMEEDLWRGLEIPYRVLEMCTGDLGAQAARKYDIEAWLPGRDGWGEVTSTSNTTDYQSRNLNIRSKTKEGEIYYPHTLNGTAIATSRAIVAILENYQTKDGKINVPKVLQKHVGKKIIQ